jgi:hypothetical protein
MFVTLLHFRFLLLRPVFYNDNTGIEPASPARMASVVTTPLIAANIITIRFSLCDCKGIRTLMIT